MSFILDALKKSENERQRTVGPSLADAPVRRQRPDRPWWAVAVAALLIVNLGVLVIVLMRDDDNASATAASATPAVAPTPAPTQLAPPPTSAPLTAAISAPVVATPTVVTSPAVRSLADEAGTGSDAYPEAGGAVYDAPSHPELAAAALVPEGPPIVRPIDAAATAAAPLPTQPTGAARTGGESLPSFNSLVAAGTSLPALHLDIHVYSNQPAGRFAFVNMRKYLEGQALSEGPTVERITPDGVVLNHQGTRFLLPRH